MRFSPQFLDDLRTRLPVSEVVGKRIKLRKAGREKTEGLVAAIIGADKAKALLDVLALDWRVAGS